MQFYLYSSQDLIINSEVFVDLKAGSIYCLKLKQNENIIIYSTHTSGSLIINLSILLDCLVYEKQFDCVVVIVILIG